MKKLIALFAVSAFVFGAGMSIAKNSCGTTPSFCKTSCKGDTTCYQECISCDGY